MGYGLRQVPADQRKTILEKGLRSCGSSHAGRAVVGGKLPGAEAEVIHRGFETVFAATAGDKPRPRARTAGAIYCARRMRPAPKPILRGRASFKALLDDVGADADDCAAGAAPRRGAGKVLKEMPPPSGLQSEFEKVPASTPAPPVIKTEPRGERFERADLGTRAAPRPSCARRQRTSPRRKDPQLLREPGMVRQRPRLDHERPIRGAKS